MAPTQLTIQQQQAVAKARARARVGGQTVNPMVAQGQAAQREYQSAGGPTSPKDYSIRPEAPAAAPRATVDLRNVNRAPQTQGPGFAEAKGSEIIGSDIAKTGRTLPQHVGNAAIGAAESTLNLPADLINSARQANAAFKPTTADAMRNVNRMPQMQETVDVAKPQAPQLPTVQAPRIPIAQEDESVSGALLEGLLQYAMVRKPLGMAAKGGGVGAQLGKDIVTTGIAFQGNSGRLTDIIDPNSIPEGPLRDYAAWLKTQPEDSPIVGRFKNMLEDATLSGPLVAPQVAVRGAQAIGNALSPQGGAGSAVGRAARAVGQQAPVAPPAASVAPVSAPAPVTAVPPTQPRPASTGQQPNAGNAAPAAGSAPAAAAQPVLNATPVAAQSPIALAKSDAKIIGRLLQAGGVARNDVNNLLTGLVQAYQGSNSSRLPLAFFAEEYLPGVLPKQTADDVIQKLRGFGRERYSANGPKDTSRSTMRNTVDTLRSSQQENLSGVMDANLYKGKLIGQEDKLNAQLEQNARTAYSTALENASNRLLNGKATQAERDALGEIQSLLHNEAFLKEVPAHLRVKALRDGIKLEDFVQQDPIAAAHWLQSELRQAVTAAEGVGGMTTSESRLYGEMRTTLLEQLEKVVPGYRGARKAHGDIYGAKEAIDFGGSFFKSARSEVETARLARQFKAMSTRQKTAATMSIRDALKNEFRNKAEDTAAKVTRLQQAGVLDALETVLGADGKRVADAIRNTVKENERIRAVDMMSGSNTADNLAQMEAAQEAVRSPVNKAIGSLGDNRSWAATLTGDALLAVNGLPPVLTGGKIASSAVGKLGKPSARKLASATKTLYDLPTPGANALASPPRTPRVSGPRSPKPTPEQAQATLDDLLRQYDALDHRANPDAGQKLLRQIDRLKKQLGGPAPNALATPPRPPVRNGSGPINKAGFGGSSLDMSEAGRMREALEQKIADLSERYRQADGAADRHYIQQEIYNLQDEIANLPSQSGSSKLLAGMGGSEGVGAATGAGIGYFGNPTDANQDGVIDDADRGLNAVGGLASGVIGGNAIKRGVGAAKGIGRTVASKIEPPLPLSPANRVFAPGKPDDLGFITAAEKAIAEPVARFRDAKKLTADQWRKYFRESGASGESFQFQIEPALKSLADRGVTGDITKTQIEEALARNRGTLGLVDKKQLGEMGFAAQATRERNNANALGRAIGQNRTREVERLKAKQKEIEQAPVEAKYDEYIAPGKSSNYQQHVLTLPPEQGQGYKSHNWRSENPVGHIRFTNRTSANGEKVLHVEELQSDLHQEGAKYGYRGEKPLDMAALQNASDAAKRKYAQWADATKERQDAVYGGKLPGDVYGESGLGKIDDPEGYELYREALAARRRLLDTQHASKVQPPKAPLENWEEPFIRYALKQGADQGVDVITFPKWDTMHEALQNEGTKKFYDQRMPAHLASVAKSLGLNVETVPLGPTNKNLYEAAFKRGGEKPYGIYTRNSVLPAKEFDTLAEAEAAVKALNNEPRSVPAIRLTPQAKQRLSEGVIMDAKDPGRRAAKEAPTRVPAQAGLGFGGKPPAPQPNALSVGAPVARKPKSFDASRGVAGAVLGGALGSSTADAQSPETAAAIKATQERIAQLEADIRTSEKGTAKEIQELLQRRGQNIKVDGVIGPETSAAIQKDRNESKANLERERAILKEQQAQAAFEKTQPSAEAKILREAAPWLGAFAGLIIGGRSRVGGVKKAAVGARANVEKANALIGAGPVRSPASVHGRASNINDFWRTGGAGESVPFQASAKGEWRPRPKAMSPSKLYPEQSPRLRAEDYAWIASGLTEAGISTVGVDMATKEIAAAQAAVEKEKSEANLERLEQAHNMLALAQAAQRFGLLVAGGRAIGAWKKPYQSSRPDIAAAEAERARILEHLSRVKQPKSPPR